MIVSNGSQIVAGFIFNILLLLLYGLILDLCSFCDFFRFQESLFGCNRGAEKGKSAVTGLGERLCSGGYLVLWKMFTTVGGSHLYI